MVDGLFRYLQFIGQGLDSVFLSFNFFSQTVPLGGIEDGDFHVVGHPRLGEVTEDEAFAGDAGHLINTHAAGEHEAARIGLDFLYLC